MNDVANVTETPATTTANKEEKKSNHRNNNQEEISDEKLMEMYDFSKPIPRVSNQFS